LDVQVLADKVLESLNSPFFDWLSEHASQTLQANGNRSHYSGAGVSPSPSPSGVKLFHLFDSLNGALIALMGPLDAPAYLSPALFVACAHVLDFALARFRSFRLLVA
tara:strand:- start:160 stop:480 length:321 start_codon:yes stop_codon:yes gene_type:complete